MYFTEEIEDLKGNSINAIYEKVSIKKVRADTGLHELKSGVLSCLRCDKKFNSLDVRGNRLCEDCKGKEDYDIQEHGIGTLY